VIADAVDTAITLGWALAAWIVLTAAAGCAAVYAGVVAAWWAGRTVWTAIGPRRALAARVSDEQPSRDPRPPEPAERRTQPPTRPAPAWAQPEQDAA
jgi:hypothetical protein